ncbi:hypothetical protein ACFQV2_14705 [Actinokineospora soli]|uniref:Uncharacterized protein n=1 Tax=Actinokineospora soli TaxID=1048753 RepID=A0ABW2TNJ3_9PSEU
MNDSTRSPSAGSATARSRASASNPASNGATAPALYAARSSCLNVGWLAPRRYQRSKNCAAVGTASGPGGAPPARSGAGDMPKCGSRSTTSASSWLRTHHCPVTGSVRRPRGIAGVVTAAPPRRAGW